MAKIDELLQELCPDGVEYVSLESILEYEQPGKYIVKNTEYNDLYTVPVLTAGKSFLLGYTNETSGVYEASSTKPTIIFDDFITSFHWVDFPCKVKSSALKFIRPKNNDNVCFRYVYYQMCTINFVAKEHVRHWISVYSKFAIPLPPVPIQQYIVEVLDTFTDAIGNLEEELSLREKQFEYYREHLYQFDDECSIKTIKDISVKCFPGATPSTKKPEYWQNGTIPWMSSGEIHQGQVKSIAGRITQLGYDSSSTKMVPINSIVVALAGQGKTRGTVAITRMELCTNQSLCAIIPDQSMVVPEYLYFYLKGQYFNLRQVSAGDGTRGGLNLKHIESYKVPVISLDRQHKIVEILDTFEAMIANIKEEIALRTKQYEYYREKLLSFGK